MRAAPSRGVIAVLLVLACAGIVFVSLTRRAADALPEVAFIPPSPPPGLKYVGISRHGGDEEDFVKREAHLARQTTASLTSTGPGYDAMTVATTAYRVGLIDPNLEGRLSGEVYASIPKRPRAHPVTVRGHDGILEIYPKRAEGAQLHVLTWIERPGVYIQISAVDLARQQLLDVAASLREQ